MKPKKFYEFLKFGNIDYLKVYLVLYHKVISWEKELEFEFSISSNIVKEALVILEKEGFIISRDFWNLSINEQEIITKINGGYSKKVKNCPKFYILNDDGKELYDYTYQNEIENLISKSHTLQISLSFIAEKTYAFKHLNKENKVRESLSTLRERTCAETGIVYFTETNTHKTMKKQIKEAVSELKKIEKSPSNKIESKKSGNLVENKKNELGFTKEKFNLKKKMTLNGEEISPSDLDRLFDKIAEADKEIEETQTIKGYGAKVDVLEEEVFDVEKKNKELCGKSYAQILQIEGENTVDPDLKNFLGIDKDEIVDSFEDNKNLYETIYNLILNKGRLSTLTVDRLCDSKQKINGFMEYIRDRNIIIDEDYDFYIFVENREVLKHEN